jgi:hypothetical protein
VKDLKLLPVLVSSLTFIGVFQIAVSRAGEWHSPCPLTEMQQTILKRLQWAQPSTGSAEISACRFYEENILLVRFSNGSMGAYGIGELNDTEAPAAQQDTQATQFRGTDEEHQLFIELDHIWLQAGLADNLSPEDLARSDMLVRQIFARTPSQQVQLADYEFLGMRGNRYRSTLEDLNPVPPAAAIVFFTAYLESSIPHARTDDLPTDQQKLTAIATLLHTFETPELKTQYHFGYEVSLEIKRLDPEAYKKFQAMELTTEYPLLNY